MSQLRRMLMSGGKPELPNYLKFTALEAGTFTLTIGASVTVAQLSYIEYSLDNGETWTKTNNVASTTVTITTTSVAAGDSVLWRGSGVRMANSSTAAKESRFSSTGTFNASGNLLSLLYGKDCDKNINTVLSYYLFSHLFAGTSVVNVSGLIFPNTVTNYCYYSMFNGCTSLTNAGFTLPATKVSQNCYDYMFQGCTSLSTLPTIMATSLNATYACRYMFESCISTTVAPTPNLTSIGSTACAYMYSKCANITTSLDFTNITVSAKQTGMFTRCNLSSIPGSSTLKYIGGNMFSYNSNLPLFVDFRNVQYSSNHFNTNTGIRRIFLPKFISANGQYSFTAVTILDIGKNCTSLGTTQVFYGTVSTLVLRCTTPPTLTSWRNNPGKVYVPSSAVATYQADSNFSSLNVYAIGGTEWQEQFSDTTNPASEYADVEKYVPSDLQSAYIALYNET